MLPLILCIIFICLGAASLTLFLLEKTKRYSLKAVFLKTTTSLFFIATATVSLIAKGYHYLSIFVALGLFMGLLGDIWLDLKYVYKQNDAEFTYAGFISFGIGHIPTPPFSSMGRSAFELRHLNRSVLPSTAMVTSMNDSR